MKNRIISAILSFLLGVWGGQHFYLGNVGKGILSILFSWTLISSIIGIIDGIRFLSMSDEKLDLMYNFIHSKKACCKTICLQSV